MTDHHHVFLSYSHGDREAAINLRGQLDRCGLSVFWDEAAIREGDLWLTRLQEAVEACESFIVLVGRDGVGRWVGAETQVALNRYFGPRDDAERLPIFPILLGDSEPASLPAFLRLFQATSWNGADDLPGSLLEQIRMHVVVSNESAVFEGCPFVGLDVFRVDQAHLFFGRQKETLDALACFDVRRGSQTVRWLEVNGNSGSGKSSLMNAGLLPLVDQGWLWPRTGFERWTRLGPMMPGEQPVTALAEQLARGFGQEMADVRDRLMADDDALAVWLRGRKQEGAAFLLAIDQFEELFTLADPQERGLFDRLLARALEDPDCPLFVISTVRADFLERFEELPRLVAARNRLGKPWTLPPIDAEGLREVIGGPAHFADLDVTEVQEAMVSEARDEAGALPLVEHALHWLWEQREGRRLSGQLFTDQGGLAGILSHGADGLLQGLDKRRVQALELLFSLVKVDPEGRRHTRRRIPLAQAVAVAGGGEDGQALVDNLAGQRVRHGRQSEGPLRLITVTEEQTGGDRGGWVNLIHETLIRSTGPDASGKLRPYWPTLWHYIEQHKHRAARRERLQLLAREWRDRTGFGRLLGLSGWLELRRFRGLAAPDSSEARYLRWSRAKALVQAVLVAAAVGLAGESAYWMVKHQFGPQDLANRWAFLLGKELPLPSLVPIEHGRFMQGSETGAADEHERPVREVEISRRFYLAATEVTFEQFDAFAVVTGYPKPSDQWGRGEQPVVNVNWSDAWEYAEWLGTTTGRTCRLPSESEWEYACRAGTTSDFAFGDAISPEDANYDGNLGGSIQVGSYPPNKWGLHDMHGNVWEWMEDCWHKNYEDAPVNGEAWSIENDGECRRLMLRGGAWSDDEVNARCSARNWTEQLNSYDHVGFRVACSAPVSGD